MCVYSIKKGSGKSAPKHSRDSVSVYIFNSRESVGVYIFSDFGLNSILRIIFNTRDSVGGLYYPLKQEGSWVVILPS